MPSTVIYALNNFTTKAEFSVFDDIQSDDIPAFTATIGGVGNHIMSASFEPIVYRDMFVTNQSHSNNIIASKEAISHWDTLKEGALDGADVSIYRINNGNLQIIKSGRVAEGGANASGWKPVHSSNSIVGPGSKQYDFEWGRYSKPEVKYYFSIKAIYNNGYTSNYSDYVSFIKPPVIDRSGNVSNNLIKYDVNNSISSVSDSLDKPFELRITSLTDGNISLAWRFDESANEVVGYQVFISEYNPDEHKGFFLELDPLENSNSDKIMAGDLVIISKKFYTASRDNNHTLRVWGASSENKLFLPDSISFFTDELQNITWKLLPHIDNTVTDGGETYLSLIALETGNYRVLEDFNHAGTSQNYYQVLDATEYTVEAWMRLNGEGNVTFKIGGFYAQPSQRIDHINFKPSSDWVHFKENFTVPIVQDSYRPGNMVLDFEGVGSLDIDNFRVYRSDTEFLKFNEAQIQQLESSFMASLRTHALIKTGRKTYDLEQITNINGLINGTSRFNTLPQNLEVIHDAKMNPWIQIEPHFTIQEWEGLLEYLAVPYDVNVDLPDDKPWAYKRHIQGYTNPWTDYFETIDFEIGNETWNRLFNPWVFPPLIDSSTGEQYSAGEVYGLYNEFVINIFKNSPYWEALNLSNKFNFIVGGWANQSFGKDSIEQTPSANYMTIAAYNGGWDEDEGPPSLTPPSFFNVLNQVSQVAIPVAIRHQNELDTINKNNNSNVMLGTYEAGPGYALHGLNNAQVSEQQAIEQEHVMKSVAAGVATLDSFLARASLGFQKQNYFTYSEGRSWSSHANWYNGGQAYPSWQLLSLFNQFTPVNILASKAISVPSVNLKASGRRKEISSAPLIELYSLKSDDDMVLILISRMVSNYPNVNHDGFVDVKINIPFAHQGSATLYLSNENYYDNNIIKDFFKIHSYDMSFSSDSKVIDFNKFDNYSENGFPPGQFAFLVLHDYFNNTTR